MASGSDRVFLLAESVRPYHLPSLFSKNSSWEPRYNTPSFHRAEHSLLMFKMHLDPLLAIPQ